MKCSVILPCYNEAKGLPALLARYAEARGDLDLEVICVDNGSRDQTPAVLAALMAIYPWARSIRVEPNRGYGDGLFQGLRLADREWLAWSHADLQTDPGDVVIAFRALAASADPQRTLIKGLRQGRAFKDQIITWGMQAVALVTLRGWYRQINAQPKAFHRDLLGHLAQPPVDFNFDIYVLYQAHRHGWRTSTIPVLFPPRPHGVSNWASTWRSKVRTIRSSIWFMTKLGLGRHR